MRPRFGNRSNSAYPTEMAMINRGRSMHKDVSGRLSGLLELLFLKRRRRLLKIVLLD